MKRSELRGKTRVPSPFSTAIHRTEWTCAAKIAEWINNSIKEKGLPLGQAEVETSQEGDRKRADIILSEGPTSQDILCLIEMKQPYFDPFDEEELKEPARKKATRSRAKYFATSNFQHLIWFDTQKANSLVPLEEQIQDKYFLSQIENLDFIEEPRYKNAIKPGLERFLTDLYEIHSGKKAKPRQAIDELLIYRLQDKIRRLSKYYTVIIDNRCHKDNTFAKELGKWFILQGWSFAWQSQDFDKAARQTAYLLVNKILFYNVLQAKRPHQLDPLEVPASLTRGSILQSTLQGYFNDVLKIDYETIYTTDFIDAIAFPDDEGVVKEIRELVNILKQYDFSKLGDVIGPIFERLIPQDERHNLGQYFTSLDVVDIILKFCLRHEDNKVLDPACGAGTFLVRAYHHKKLKNQFLKHEDVLKTLWGTDIAKFPAHLSTINLAIRDLSVDKNYPNILQEDFFNLLSTEGGFELPTKARKAIAKTLGIKEREVTYPRWFDCVVGNPPYTRQEEMPEIAPEIKEYKQGIIDKALKDNTGRTIAEISKRAGIHAYFFVHGMKFLRDGGRFGFIVSNSWLDVDYGKGLQEFFLNNYKIGAIIESKVERWFEEADVNTCIVILEKCKDKRDRDENPVRFVYLFKPLSYFIPPAQEMWQKQNERLNEIDKLVKTIMAHSQFYQNEELRIFSKSQKELWEEGFDKGTGKYLGAKWGKYLRAPEIFFKILEKGKRKLIPLREIADVRRGFTTGADPWFYVEDSTDFLGEGEVEKITGQRREALKTKGLRLVKSGDGTRWLIESQYLAPITRNPDDFRSIRIREADIKTRAVVIDMPRKNLRNKHIEAYIKHGETRLYDMGKGKRMVPSHTLTCSARRYWYQLPDVQPSRLLWQKAIDRYHRHYMCDMPTLANQRFYNIYPKEPSDEMLIACCLNSSFTSLQLEFQRAAMGLGAIEATVEEVCQLPVIEPSKVSEPLKTKILAAFQAFYSRPVESIFDEMQKKERHDLDGLLLETLGFKEPGERESIISELYDELANLAKARFGRAKSFGKRQKTREGINIDLLIKTVTDKLGDDTLGKFYREKILPHKPLRTKSLPRVSGEVKLEQELFGWRLSAGREHIDCDSETEARYIKVWLEAGLDSVKIPKDEDYLGEIVPKLENLKQKTDEVFEDHLGFILDPRLRQRLLHQLWQEATK
ncbi:MAG: N-6 DNA methylase [Dehalococcoidia bacterium]